MIAKTANADPRLAEMLKRSRERREARMVAGYEFHGGALTGTEQHKAYTEKLGDIRALSVELGKRS
jgi:hypothetical protein